MELLGSARYEKVKKMGLGSEVESSNFFINP